jgi:josephin
MLGLGNYDVNVLMTALQSKGYEAKWFDKRKPLDILVMENIYGFVLNVPSAFRLVGIWPLPFKQKHWIALRGVDDGIFFNLDSNLGKAEKIGKVRTNKQELNSSVTSCDKARRGGKIH